LMMLLMAGLAGLGFMIKYVLISGKDRVGKFGHQGEVYFWGWDRHEWGSVHLIIGFVLLGLIILHIILHWQTITILFSQLIANKTRRRVLAVVYSLFCLALFVLPLFVPVEFVETGPGYGQNASRHFHYADSTAEPVSELVANPVPQSPGGSAGQRVDEHTNNHEHNHSAIRVQGFMTLAQVSDQYNIPVERILSGLQITESVSPDETFGRLKKRYSLQMSDVETIILKYQSEIINRED